MNASPSMLNSTSQGAGFAAVIVSGAAVILLALRLQKGIHHLVPAPALVPEPPIILLRPCIYYDGETRKKKKKKRVHFAADVVEPAGNGEVYRWNRRNNKEEKRTPANRMALYNGILRDRLAHHCLGYSH